MWARTDQGTEMWECEHGNLFTTEEVADDCSCELEDEDDYYDDSGDDYDGYDEDDYYDGYDCGDPDCPVC